MDELHIINISFTIHYKHELHLYNTHGLINSSQSILLFVNDGVTTNKG